MSSIQAVNILVIIPARGGSKGIPRKNLRSLAGKPLIAYAINTARQSIYKPDVYVSSEDKEILTISQKLGAEIYERPKKLSKDLITLDPVIYDAYEQISLKKNKEYELIVTLQPTSPLLKTASLDAAISFLLENKFYNTIMSCVKKVGLSWGFEENKFVPNFKKRLNRQELPPTFYETGGFLICTKETIRPNSRLGENVYLHELDHKEGIDIDDYDEWNLCDYYLKQKTILISTIGYPEIGLGHIYNTLLLANRILNHKIIFLVDDKSELGYNKIAAQNYEVYMQQEADIKTDIFKLNPDVVINDRLDTTLDDMNALKEAGILVINFEDLGEGSKEADLVFNAIYPEKEKLPNHHYGPDYFCARDEFLLSPIKKVTKKVQQVLITFGGTDPNNLTKKTLEAIYPYCKENNIEIKIVLGLGYSAEASLSQYKDLEIKKNIPNISEYMVGADLVFTSAGRTTYELALLGIPTIVLAQNDRELTHFFAYEENGFVNLGLGKLLSTKKIKSVFEEKVNNFESRKQMHSLMMRHNIRNGISSVIKLINERIMNYEFN